MQRVLTRDFPVVGHLCCYCVWTCTYDNWHVTCHVIRYLCSRLRLCKLGENKNLNSFYHIALRVPFLGLIIQNIQWLQEPLNTNRSSYNVSENAFQNWVEGSVYQMRSGSNMFSFLCNMTHQLAWLLLFSVCDVKNILVSNTPFTISTVHHPHSCSPDPPLPPCRNL